MELEQQLSRFIALQTVAGDKSANKQALEFLQQELSALAFAVEVLGNSNSEHDQPILVAKLGDTTLPTTLVLYNHYDVEKVHADEVWQTSPFALTSVNGRFFGRGIADNKAPLLLRIETIRQRIKQGRAMPPILWLIQGEEEVGAPLAHQLFPELLSKTQAKLFLEETGYQKEDQPMLFHVFDSTVQPSTAKALATDLGQAVFAGKFTTEHRHLTKFGACPFVKNLPVGAHYIGFGPNDALANIHQANESISIELLAFYAEQFDRFLDWCLTFNLASYELN